MIKKMLRNNTICAALPRRGLSRPFVGLRAALLIGACTQAVKPADPGPEPRHRSPDRRRVTAGNRSSIPRRNLHRRPYPRRHLKSCLMKPLWAVVTLVTFIAVLGCQQAMSPDPSPLPEPELPKPTLIGTWQFESPERDDDGMLVRIRTETLALTTAARFIAFHVVRNTRWKHRRPVERNRHLDRYTRHRDENFLRMGRREQSKVRGTYHGQQTLYVGR